MLLFTALLHQLRPAAATPQLAECDVGTIDDGRAELKVKAVDFQPSTPRAGEDLEARVEMEVLAADGFQRAEGLRVHISATFCRRLNDCMELYRFEEPFCGLANLSAHECSGLAQGEKVVVTRSAFLPEDIFRGAYDVVLQVRDGDEVIACSVLLSVVVTTRVFWNHFCDIRDALIAFLVAASSSKQLGSFFPSWSCGVLPQISGFLLMGIVVGPYLTNLVTLLHIHILGKWINHLSLAFIAGAAGLEIFFPDLRELIRPMLLQVLLVTVSTLTICTVGLLVISTSGLVSVDVLLSQPSFLAQASVSLVAGALMVARSPASAIAVISEMQCNHMSCSKIVLGVTVLSDIAVLILFALATSVARVVTLGGSIGIGTFLAVVGQIGVSVLLGTAASQLLRLCVPPAVKATSRESVEEAALLESPEGATGRSSNSAAVRGLLVIALLFVTYELSSDAEELTGGLLRLEPILACTTAACLAGHDEDRRHNMEEALSYWTSFVLLPFFTLAGASLQLPGLAAVLPAAVALVVLRMVGIASGSMLAGVVSQSRYPQLNLSKESVRFTWLTMLAQAGVTLGLVLEVQDAFTWGHEFGTLVIGVVVINQLMGPVLCRVGLGLIVEAEKGATIHAPPESPNSGQKLLRVNSGIAH